jgi:hypothetical protein
MRNTARLSCPDCPTIYQHRYLPKLIFKKIRKPRKKLYLEWIYAFFGPKSLGSLPNSYQGWKKPGFLKKTQPGGFFWVFLGFIGFYWVFLGFIGFLNLVSVT